MTRPTRGGPRRGAGRPALPEGERRSVRLMCWVTPAERAKVDALAEGQSLSDWVRAAVLQALEPAG